jgi:GNAT superfamily N-acetyltransferase
VKTAIEIRELARDELALVRDIDRTERIEVLYVQQGTELVERPGEFDAPAWYSDGDGEHSVAAQHRTLVGYVDHGGIAMGAFLDTRFVGIGVVVPHVRPSIAQLAYLHVTNGSRSGGIGSRLITDLESIARRAGDREIVVTATPSLNTVRFYRRHGYRPMATPLPELFELEPEDVHMSKPL